MKKLLAIFGAFGLVATSGGFASSVVSCNGDTDNSKTYINYYNEFKDKTEDELQIEYNTLSEVLESKEYEEKVNSLSDEQEKEASSVMSELDEKLESAEKKIETYSKLLAEYGSKIEAYLGKEYTLVIFKIQIITWISDGIFK